VRVDVTCVALSVQRTEAIHEELTDFTFGVCFIHAICAVTRAGFRQRSLSTK
jgi:hypothetical protein